ncbi:hypothetical protein L7F22_024169 [Adiantum nelumboides]|nr:hypothetical protein [Adiantum nelumboides]
MRIPNVTAEHDDINGHSRGSKHSLDEELGIPSIRTPSVRRLHAENIALGSNAEQRRSRRNRWQEAMNEEMDTLYGNQTWELVPLLKGRYTARLVAKGYAQTYGIDYEETFAHVTKMKIVRAVTAVVATKGWLLHQMDVKNAFLHGILQEKVYIENPPSFQDTGHPDYVCKL